MQIPNLDEAVVNALNFFSENPPPEFNINDFDLPFVVGSGNAYNTGQILFSEKAAVFADESNFKALISAYKNSIDQKLITQALIISASGGKDSIWELELAQKYNLQTTLLTTKKDSEAAKIADNLVTYSCLDEPYTYNTSTYMGMILSRTKESVTEILNFIENLKFPDNFKDYESFSFVLPDKYSSVCPMLDIKKSELFGPLLSLRAFPQGHARHAKFVIRDKKELVISINSNNEFYGSPTSRWDFELPAEFNFAAVMAITYYIIGQIQASKPSYFKDNIGNYVNDYGPKAYEKEESFDLIVPGNNGK